MTTTTTTLPAADQQALASAELHQRVGTTFFLSLMRALKTAALHYLENDAIVKVRDQLVTALAEAHKHCGLVQIQCVGDYIFLNNEVLKIKPEHFEASLVFRQLFKKLGISEITLEPGVSADDLHDLLARYQSHLRSGTPQAFVNEKFQRISLRKIEQVSAGAQEAFEIDPRQNVLRNYALVAIRLREALEASRAGRLPRFERVRRAAQGLVDASQGYSGLVVGLTRFDSLRGDAAFRSAAAAALVMLMGRHARLARPELMSLFVAALLKDFGAEGLHTATLDTDAALRQLEEKRAPLLSALQIGRGTVDHEALERVAMAFEVALPHNDPREVVQPSTSAKLIAVSDAYCRLTMPLKGERGQNPDEAIRFLQELAGTRFDERVVKLFVATVGLYPVGTTVRLSGGQVAIVVEVPDDPANFAAPLVKLVRDENGALLDSLVDLSEPGISLRIIESVDATENDVNVPYFLLA